MWGYLVVSSKPARLAKNPVACVTANVRGGEKTNQAPLGDGSATTLVLQEARKL